MFDIKDLIYFEYDELNLADGVEALALKIGDPIKSRLDSVQGSTIKNKGLTYFANPSIYW
jgi:hypothetical protein